MARDPAITFLFMFLVVSFGTRLLHNTAALDMFIEDDANKQKINHVESEGEPYTRDHVHEHPAGVDAPRQQVMDIAKDFFPSISPSRILPGVASRQDAASGALRPAVTATLSPSSTANRQEAVSPVVTAMRQVEHPSDPDEKKHSEKREPVVASDILEADRERDGEGEEDKVEDLHSKEDEKQELWMAKLWRMTDDLRDMIGEHATAMYARNFGSRWMSSSDMSPVQEVPPEEEVDEENEGFVDGFELVGAEADAPGTHNIEPHEMADAAGVAILGSDDRKEKSSDDEAASVEKQVLEARVAELEGQLKRLKSKEKHSEEVAAQQDKLREIRARFARKWDLGKSRQVNHGPSPAGVPDIGQEGYGRVLRWAAERTRQAEDEFREYSRVGAQKEFRYPSPENWADSIIYNIQVDRFNNGDVENDDKNLPSWQQYHGDENDFSSRRAVPYSRHGGDIAGITQRLPYLKDLGINVLWITPVFGHNGEYHGYCASDPTIVDPGFGSAEELRHMVSEAHKLGIRIMLDVVANHMCDVSGGKTYYSPSRTDDDLIKRCSQALESNYWDGDAVTTSKQVDLRFSPSFFAAFRSQSFFNRCGPSSKRTRKYRSVAVFADFRSKMYDYNTRDIGFQGLFTELHKYWIAYLDVDGFRIDAAAHVTEDFLLYFASETRAYAAKLGKTNFWTVGEVTGSPQQVSRTLGSMGHDPEKPGFIIDKGLQRFPAGHTERLYDRMNVYLANPEFSQPGLNSVFNFAQSKLSVSTFHGKANVLGLESFFQSQSKNMYAVASQVDPFCNKHDNVCAHGLSQLWTCLEIHDWPRFIQDFPERIDMSLLGITWLLTAPGQPVLQYGQEQGFNGNCVEGMPVVQSAKEGLPAFCGKDGDDAKYRQDMFVSGPFRLGSAIEQLNNLAGIDAHKSQLSPDWKSDPMLSRDHEIFRTVRKLTALRRSCPALTEGAIVFRYAEDAADGLIIFSRISPSPEDAEIVVLINPSGDVKQLPSIEVDIQLNPYSDDEWQDVMTAGDVAAVTKVHDGKVSLEFKIEIAKWSSLVLVRTDHLSEFDDDLGISLCAAPFKTPRSRQYSNLSFLAAPTALDVNRTHGG